MTTMRPRGGEQLRQLGGNNEHSPCRAQRDPGRSVMISALEPMSTPAVGSSRMKMSGSVFNHLPMTTFCWFPPESVRLQPRARRVLIRRPSICRSAASLALADDTNSHEASRSRMEREVLDFDRVLEHEPLPQPILRNEREAVGDRIDRALDLDRRAPDADFTRSLWIDPERSTRQRATSAAEQGPRRRQPRRRRA